ncbi:cysteine-rich receptor-like protein kinase 25 [Miscanthus floridulus]|uniref:cysteine-rich receptor-like protein kinase 25 n=1 Tax=Miscanthus floridulus TaxID=154761 RepID=UPI003458DB32
MASPSATVLCTAAGSFRLAPNMVVLFFLAAALLATPTRSSSPSSHGACLQQPTLTLCSGHSPAVTSSEVTRFLAAVCAGAYGVVHMSHNMSSYVVPENRNMYGVAQCRPDVSVSDCAACLAAASKLIAGTACAASAVWHDACFLRYSDHDPGRFREDEYTATVFNASRALQPHEGSKAEVRRLLATVANSTMSSHMCSSVGAGTGTASGGRIYGLTQCAAGISCADCRRCLRGALEVVDRAYNGSAGMQVLRLSCMARYESYPFYNTESLALRLLAEATSVSGTVKGTATVPAATPAVPAPPGGRNPPPPSPPAQARAPPPPASRTTVANATVGFPPGGGAGAGAAQPTPAPPGGHTPQPAAAAPNHRTATGSSESKGKGMSNRSKWIIISLATGLAIAAIILALTIWYCRKRRPAQRGHVIEPLVLNRQVDGMPEETMHDQGNNKHLSREEDDDDGGRTSCQLYNYQVLEAATCCFSSRNKLGSGGFGTVYKGTLENGKEVAVKRLRDSKRTIQELEREISIVVNLRHMNLVRFLGYCFQEEGRFFIYEYVPNNSLDKFWYKASFQGEKLEWATWFNIILGVARGLRFLHDKGIIHRDLKPHNILLDDNFNPKIADFDLMRMYDKEKTHESTEKVAGTFGYMAPECTSGRKLLLSIKSDVYSYGVLVLEIITGHKIYTFEGQDSEGLVEYVWQHWTEKRGSDVVDDDLGVEGQEHAARQALRCVHVALLCVQSDRARRPTMGQVIAMLSSHDGAEELPEPSLPGYIVRPTAASGVQLCFGCSAAQDADRYLVNDHGIPGHREPPCRR